MATLIGREIHLASRPTGWPTPDNFSLVEAPVPAVGPGQVLVRNRFLSVDPYMRGRMNDVKSYVPPFRVGEAMEGGAVGEVVDPGDSALSRGDLVLHQSGWREYAVLDAERTSALPPVPGLSPSVYLGALGMPGLTAYVGLLDIAGMQPGDQVFVSSAAGAVGSLAGQIARLRGASRVIGSAGTAAKVAYVRDLGFDAAFDYHDGPVSQALAQAAPDGIDVYFDNVGGDHLAAAISRLRRNGRAALCGAIAGYNAETPVPGPANLALVITKRLTLRGFIITDHRDRMPDFIKEMSGWLREGNVRFNETYVDGIEHAVDAFLGVFQGTNTGKMIVRLD
ncbi:NADP-dependent oxidoreductase [Rugosimonospora africana]|uniref:NADP-dependent oxidoreductase n=1 Tax=Rugosimonospora africana TaxID=556532 RepID=A0A8J3QWB5_9ACTN|nr:NADP-dependent oxidoreductase [Rugosimonospora africana]GIH17003.1 NADP-dependent oxidoreductase [Rugosimonospora africana]